MIKKSVNNIKSNYLVTYVAFLFIYAIGYFLSPSNPRFELSIIESVILRLSVFVPVAIAWFGIYYGSLKFMLYAKKIYKYDEGKAIYSLAKSFYITFVGYMLITIISLVKNYITTEETTMIYSVVSNYLNILIYLTIFISFYNSTNKIIFNNLKHCYISPDFNYRKAISYVMLSIGIVIYTVLMLSNEYRNFSPDYSTVSSFYLNDFLLISTVMIPYVAIWVLGLESILNIRIYIDNIKGFAYKDIFRKISSGLTIIISFNILYAMLTSLSSVFAESSLGIVLLLVYGIIILYVIGFVLIAQSANKLSKIEDI